MRASRLLALCLSLLLPAIAAADSFAVLTQNLDRLFDDVDDGNREERVLSRERFHARARLAAEHFGEHFELPQVIALQEIENLNVLEQIARVLRLRYGADYRGVVLPGNDISGINVGFLVHAAVEIREVRQLFRRLSLEDSDLPLFSRPPLYLEACRVDACLVLVNLHLRSMRGLDDPERRGPVLDKRRQQAEAVAAWVQRFQQDHPGRALMLLGDFNALTPSDAWLDVAGILRGDPDNRRAAVAGRDLVEPDLVDLTARIPQARRYSYIFRGRKQQLDYMLVNRELQARLESIAYGRILYRLSDHAGLLARLRW